jgi:hypothetical protein
LLRAAVLLCLARRRSARRACFQFDCGYCVGSRARAFSSSRRSAATLQKAPADLQTVALSTNKLVFPDTLVFVAATQRVDIINWSPDHEVEIHSFHSSNHNFHVRARARARRVWVETARHS